MIAVVLAVHGLGEHIHRYDHVFSIFAEHGIMVKGMDYRGHGRTLKKNLKSVAGYHTSFEQIWADLLELQDVVVDGVDVSPNTPTFVMGHSLGGLLALTFVANNFEKIRNFAGVISQGIDVIFELILLCIYVIFTFSTRHPAWYSCRCSIGLCREKDWWYWIHRQNYTTS